MNTILQGKKDSFRKSNNNDLIGIVLLFILLITLLFFAPLPPV